VMFEYFCFFSVWWAERQTLSCAHFEGVCPFE